MNRQITFFAIGLLSFSLWGLFPSMSYAFKEEDPATASLTNIKNTTDNNIQDDDINRFTNAITQVKDYYVQPISDKKLLEDAIRGMLSGLDPHSEYLDEDSYKTLLMTTSGAFGGLGIEVTGEYGVLKVISPIDDTPASRAGIKPGDYIVAINNKLVNEMTLREAVDEMRGKKGTHVTLTVIRKNEKKPLNFNLVRDEIRITSVKGKMLDDGYGYIRITEFQEPTTELMISEIDKLKKDNGGKLKGLVLDLRNNPGGLLETAVQVADVFLDPSKLNDKYNDLIVYTEGRLPNSKYSAKITPKPNAGDILDGAPMVVLVNEGSASASEIVAGALQDYRRAMIIGIQSFGKGSVQTVLPLDQTHAIKLTTALYHTPSGRLIQNKGITPDVRVEDLQVAGNKADTSMLSPIREFELKGHLPNQTGTKNTSPTTAAPLSEEDLSKLDSDAINLARSDFQLYEAIKILNTMGMVSSMNLNGTNKSSAAPSSTITKK